MAYKDFTQFPVYQKAFNLLVRVYEVSGNFPKEERYGMTSDIRRSANSVTHNVPEGYGRFEKRDKTRFYKIARGSAYEIISQLLASSALGFLKSNEEKELTDGYKEVINELDKLIKTVESR